MFFKHNSWFYILAIIYKKYSDSIIFNCNYYSKFRIILLNKLISTFKINLILKIIILILFN